MKSFLASNLRALSAFAILAAILTTQTQAALDTNNNLLSDLWEKQHNNGNLFPPAILAENDEDLDGWTNAQEAAAATDPFDPNPPDGILTITITPSLTQGAFTLTWPTQIGKNYQLKVSTDLTTWTNLGDPITTTQATHSIGINTIQPDTAIPPKVFWRVTVSDLDTDGDGLTDAEENELRTDQYSANSIPGIPDLWLATHFSTQLLTNGIAGINMYADPDGDGYTNLEEYLNGTDPNVFDAPTEQQWIIVKGDGPQGEPRTRTKQITIPKGQTRLIVVAIASEEYPQFTEPDDIEQFDDLLTWNIAPSGQTPIEGEVHVNDRHVDWQLAEIDGQTLTGIPSPVHYEVVKTVTAPETSDLTIDVEITATNIADGLLPSYLAVGIFPVDLAVDANRNGMVEFGIDRTSAATPYRFWVNSHSDIEEDEENHDGEEPDHADNSILAQRDLEDFARIQLMIGGLHEQLKSGEIQVTMKFKEGTVEGNPALNLWLHLDQDGGRDYLLDEQIAARHLVLANPGRVTASISYTFQPGFWTGEGIEDYPAITSEKPYRYLLFEGASKGKGELVLEFKKGSEVLGEGCSCWINLLDVRNMYQRAKVTPDHPDNFTEPSDFVGGPFNPTITPPVPEIGWSWDPNGENFIEDPEEEQQYLVFVHGWRMTYVGSQKYAESMFKRLWQTGYKGRFAFVRWPTYSEDTHPWPTDYLTYNASDYRAWLSGKGVAAFVNSLPSSHVRNITAHSMGNVVVSSALREGMQVDNYALLNAAIPAMCYDGNNALYEFERETPDGDADPITKALGFKEKILQTNGASLINFYLANDFALSDENFGWVANNKNFKPESFNLGTTGYDYDPNRAAGTKIYITFWTEFGRHLRSFHESASYATASRTKAVGADGRTAGAINDKVDMNAQYGFGSTHSAEWLWRIQKPTDFTMT